MASTHRNSAWLAPNSDTPRPTSTGVEGNVRVQGAMADEQPGPHRAGLGAPAGRQAAVDAGHAGQLLPRAGERQDRQAAEAEADRREAPVGVRAAREGRQAGPAPPDQERGIIAQGGEALDDPLPVARRALAEHVARMDDVSERRVTARLLSGMLVEPAAAGHEEYSGPPAGKRLVPVQHSGERSIQVTVGQGLCRNLHAGSFVSELTLPADNSNIA